MPGLPNCFLDSFSHYSTNDLYGIGNGQKWSGYLNQVGSIGISAGTGLYGNSLRLTPGSASNPVANIWKNFANIATWVIGFRFRMSIFPVTGQNACLISLSDGTYTQCALQVNSSGQINLVRGDGTSIAATPIHLAINTWYYIEWMVTISNSIAANSCQVNFNGINVINVASGTSTRHPSSTNNYANALYLGPIAALTGSFSNPTGAFHDYCDFYVDGGGAVNGGAFWGITQVTCTRPVQVSPINNVWVASNGNPNGCVADPTPDGDADYISSANVGDKSGFTFSPIATGTPNITCVQLCYASRATGPAASQITDYSLAGGNGQNGPAVNQTTSYGIYTDVYNTAPNGTSWTQASLQTTEFGVIRTA